MTTTTTTMTATTAITTMTAAEVAWLRLSVNNEITLKGLKALYPLLPVDVYGETLKTKRADALFESHSLAELYAALR